MASSTLKAVILVAVVVVGVILLRGAFPESTGAPIGDGGSGSGSTTPGASVSPSVSPSVSLRPVGSVRVQVLNGTPVQGLANDVSVTLRGDGYKMAIPGNAPTARRTVVYFQDGYQANAQALAEERFPGARVQPAPDSVPNRIHIQVILGENFQPG